MGRTRVERPTACHPAESWCDWKRSLARHLTTSVQFLNKQLGSHFLHGILFSWVSPIQVHLFSTCRLLYLWHHASADHAQRHQIQLPCPTWCTPGAPCPPTHW